MKTGGFYSFVVWAVEEVPLPEHLLLLEPGMNAFNAQLEDLDGFIACLREAKVEVRQVNNLTDPSFVPLTNLLTE